jgi:hypothetical protein
LADGDIQTSPTVTDPVLVKERPWYYPHTVDHKDKSTPKSPLHVLAVFPYFATHAHCDETGSATSDGKSFVRCDRYGVDIF